MYTYIVNIDIFLYALLFTMVSIHNNVVHNSFVQLTVERYSSIEDSLGSSSDMAGALNW